MPTARDVAERPRARVGAVVSPRALSRATGPRKDVVRRARYAAQRATVRAMAGASLVRGESDYSDV